MADVGLTHVALPARDIEASVAFYARYAAMRVVHRRADPETGHRVVWMGDGTRPFVIVLLQVSAVDAPLGGFAHLGVGCASRADVDALVALARAEGRRCLGPTDSGPPVGYWAIIGDPDGHNLELSFGQEVGRTVGEHGRG